MDYQNENQTHLATQTQDESLSYAWGEIKSWGLWGLAACVSAKVVLGILAGNRSE